MVSFTCTVCQDVVKKPKVCSHVNVCRGATFACVDCMEVFDIRTVKDHTSCVTEVEKYQGKWRRNAAGNVPRRQPADDSDSDRGNNKNNSSGAKRMRMPAMDLSSDSDDGDDSWVRQRKCSTTDVATKTTSKTSVPAATLSASVAEKPINGDSAAKRPRSEGQRKRRLQPEPLLLPRAVCSTEASECVVPSFVLGSEDEVVKVARWALEDAGAPSSLSLKELTRRLVGCYEARLARQLRGVVEALARRGKLRLEDGAVTMGADKRAE